MKSRYTVPVLFILLGLAYYVPRIHSAPGFVGDDFYLITHALDQPLTALSASGDYYYYAAFRPLLMLSLSANHAIAGSRAELYLYVNLVLFLAIVVLLYMVILRLQEDFLGGRHPVHAGLAAAVFLVHGEVYYNVIWIAQRTESLMLLPWLAALLLAIRYIRRPDVLTYGAMLLLFLLSLLAKSTGLHFPLLFIGLHLLYRRAIVPRSVPWREMLRRALPLFLVMLLYLTVRALYDPGAEPLPLEWLLKKPFSVAGMTLAALYPPLAEFLYQVAGYAVVPAAVATLLVTLILCVPFLLVRSWRWTAILLIGMYLCTLFPRIMAWMDPRTITIQIVFLLVIAGVLSVRLRRAAAVTLLGVMIVLHLISGMSGMDAWIERETKTDLMRIAQLIEEGELDGATSVFSDANAQRILPYQVHFWRHNSFGVDSTVLASGYGYFAKPLGRRSVPGVRVDGDTVHVLSGDGRLALYAIDPMFADSTVALMDARGLGEFSPVSSLSLRIVHRRPNWAYLVILPGSVIEID